MDKDSKIKRILEENVFPNQRGLTRGDRDILGDIIVMAFKVLTPRMARLISTIVITAIAAYNRKLPMFDTSENEYWTKKIKEILFPTKPK